MSDSSISVFLPVRKGSQRVPEKNTRRFSTVKNGLLGLKLQQLTETKEIDEIVISTNDEKCFEIARFFQKDSRIRIDERPGELATSETDLKDLITYSGKVCSKDHIFWTHVTSPFFGSDDYKEAIQTYRQNLLQGYDSLLTGRNFKEFLLDPEKKKIVNNKSDLLWPRTQDLQDLFVISNAAFIAPRVIFNEGQRIGKRPFYMYSGKIASLDIDDAEDFEIAEMIYEKIAK